jgi:exodeoxyribonuclease V beta subunit
VTSYTALVARAPVLAEDEGTDHGDIAAGDAVVVEAIAAPSAAPTLVPLHAFPRGAAAGIALHAVLEHVDFPSYDPAAARPGVEVELARQGLDRAAWGELVAAALGGVIDTPLADGGPRLRDLRPGAWRTRSSSRSF